MSFDIHQYTEHLRAIAAIARAKNECKQAALAKRERKRQQDYIGTVTAWWNNQSPVVREHPWSINTIAAAAFAGSPRKPSIQRIAEALRRLGFSERRDWTKAGRNRRYWNPPNP